jgi:hypothetical protein
MSNRSVEIQHQWDKVEDFLSQEQHESYQRLLPVFYAARRHPLLQTLVPYTHNEVLGFSFETIPPWSDGFPGVGPTPNILEMTILQGLRDRLEFSRAPQLLDHFFSYHPDLIEEVPDAFIRFDECKKVAELPELVMAVDWILANTRERFTYFKSMSLLWKDRTSFKQIDGVDAAIAMLVMRVNELIR